MSEYDVTFCLDYSFQSMFQNREQERYVDIDKEKSKKYDKCMTDYVKIATEKKFFLAFSFYVFIDEIRIYFSLFGLKLEFEKNLKCLLSLLYFVTASSSLV